MRNKTTVMKSACSVRETVTRMSKMMKSFKQISQKMSVGMLAALIFASSISFNTTALAQGTHRPPAGTQAPSQPAPQQTDATKAQQSSVIDRIEATQAALVSEFDVNGLKVLVKRRAGSQTVAAGLFIRGGARNITAENAGDFDY